ncbi:MAG: hypothetical protein IT331_02280 [Anaerolineae bacterium]|nr:hypothetical protein [Anaerolineae bacterium]
MQTDLTLTNVTQPSWRSILAFSFVIAFGFAFAALCIFALNFFVLNGGMPAWWPDTYEYAVAAKNVSEGRGLVTTASYVLDTFLLRDFGVPQPYVHHDTGLPLWMGFVMYFFGSDAEGVGWTGGISYILTVPLTFLLGMRLYNKAIGVLAALLALINIQLITYSVTGLSEMPYAFFMTLFLLTLYVARNRWMLLLAGALFGWLWVFRSNTIAALPWVLLFVALAPLAARSLFGRHVRLFQIIYLARRDIFLRLTPFLLGMLLVVTPNFVRAYQTLGNPLYNINSMYALVFNTDAFAGKTKEFLSDVAPDWTAPEYILTHPDQLWNKVTYQVPQQLGFLWNGGLSETPTVVDAIQIILLLLGAFIPRRGETQQQRLFRWMIYATILSGFALGAVTTLRWRHFYGYLPVLLVLVAEFVLRANSLKWKRVSARLGFMNKPAFVIAIVTLVFGLFTLRTVLQTTENGQMLDRQYRQMGRWLRENVPPDAIVLIWRAGASYGRQNALAWYSDRETAELAEYTADYFARQRGEREMYVMFVNLDPVYYPAALAETGLEHFTEVSERPLANGWGAFLYAAP